MEKIILTRINYFCNYNNLIPINQAGFQKGRSTVEHLVKLTTHIKSQFARRKNILATFFDISKAFDQVWHYKLLQKLKNFNFHGKMLNFISNFIKDRKIQVRIGNTYSKEHILEMGLPQGSVLSPILFNIFTADLPKIFDNDTTVS